MAARLLNLIALASLAVLASNYAPVPVAALSVQDHHVYPRMNPHAALARKREPTQKRCKPRNAPGSGSSSPPVPPKTSSPAPKPSPPPPPPSSSPPSSNSGNKAGLAWANHDDTKIVKWKGVSAVYTWSPYVPPSAKQIGALPVPMLWGRKQAVQFQQLVVKGYANHVLTFNEPNQSGQAELSPQDAVQLWWQYIEPLNSQGYKCMSPAPTNAPSGPKWLDAFFAACSGCNVHAVAVHWYGTDPQAMIDYLVMIHNRYNRPVWVTEFACQNFSGLGSQCSRDQVFNFMKTVKDFMDNTPWIEQYFWFGALQDMGNVNPLNSIMNADYSINALGQLYIS